MSDFILHVDQDEVLADFQLGYVTQTNSVELLYIVLLMIIKKYQEIKDEY
jgi:hypothetical protein